jgi:hypothetical protein
MTYGGIGAEASSLSPHWCPPAHDRTGQQSPAHIRESLNQCRVLGGERFKDQIEAALSRRVRPPKAGRPKTKMESKAEIPV